MTQNAFGFDLKNEELIEMADGNSADYAPIPEGWYDMVVDKAEAGKTQKGDEKLSLTFMVNSGEHQGRLVFANMVYGHPKQQVQQIAQSQMAKISSCACIDPKVHADFEGARLGVKVTIKPAVGDYKARNEAKAFGPVPEVSAPSSPDRAARKPSW